MSEQKLRTILEAEVTGTMYDVVVGNFVGNVYHGENEKEARKVFKDYVEKSDMGYGSVGHEPVTLFFDGQVIQEHKWAGPKKK